VEPRAPPHAEYEPPALIINLDVIVAVVVGPKLGGLGAQSSLGARSAHWWSNQAGQLAGRLAGRPAANQSNRGENYHRPLVLVAGSWPGAV